MADFKRGQLVSLVLCCVSGGMAVSTPAAAEKLPPLQVDPNLLGPLPVRPVRTVPSEPTILSPAPAAPPFPLARPTVQPTPVAQAPSNAQPVAGTVQSINTPTVAVTAGAPGGIPPQPGTLPPPRRAEREETAPKDLPAALPLSATARIAPSETESPRPSFLLGDRVKSVGESQMVAEGEAELRQTNKVLKADRITYNQDLDEVDAEGNVRLSGSGNLVTGPRMKRKLDAATGFFDQPEYVLKTDPKPGQPLTGTTGYGHADRLEFEGEDRYRLKKATYTTCSPTNPDWYTQADDLYLDYTRLVGEGKNGKVVFKGVPIFYAPMLDFSLSNARKSGFLTPTLGTSSTSGVDATLPYYWNIAPDMDATFSPRLLARRGVQLAGEFRYLEPSFNGVARYDYLHQDRVYGASRSAYFWAHNQNLSNGFSAHLDVNGVSDNNYFTDLGTSITATSQSTLARKGSISYDGAWWGATTGVQRYQTLQDPANPVAIPYDRLPYVTVFANRPSFLGGTSFAFSGSFDDFVVSDPTNVNRPEGRRTVLYPQLSLPMVFGGVNITPKIGYHETRYTMGRVQNPGDPTSLSRGLPILSLDSSIAFERNMAWQGKTLTQTLEPRLYYLAVPYRDQSRFPVFDSALADFNFAQIFSENIYSGSDRIADANQLTAALTSRIIDPATGAQTLQAAIGQRFYFRGQAVTLPGEVPRTSSKADILAAVNGTVLPYTYLDSGWQYNPQAKATQRFSLGGRYQPEPQKVMSIGYRLKRNTAGTTDGIRDFNVSGQWPLSGRWYGLGVYNYSLHDKNLVEALGGLEYDGGCWVGRFVMQRFATTTLTHTTALFFQLELNGFSRLGSDPGEVLRRSIAGYRRINETREAPLFGVE